MHWSRQPGAGTIDGRLVSAEDSTMEPITTEPTDSGAVIDAHHHLWDLSMGRHPWLAPTGGLSTLGDLDYLRQSYGVEEFAADSAGTGVVASVHVEALWDPARDPAEETAWLDTLPLRNGIAARCVAAVPLAHPNVEGLLAAQSGTHASPASGRPSAGTQTPRSGGPRTNWWKAQLGATGPPCWSGTASCWNC
jgi:predicted TIM-barrel fold metal-dependent hydrolase